MGKKTYQKPFIKWVGGKTQLIDMIMSKFPNKINNYHEPFLGGGSVMFALLSCVEEGKIELKGKVYAYDVNESLVNVYRHIQKNHEELYSSASRYMSVYDSLTGSIVNRNPKVEEDALTSKESYYYWMRKLYNDTEVDSLQHAALFLCVNKTCFRGMYREGPRGYNVPYGHYKKTPQLPSIDEFNRIHNLIVDVEFIHSDFNDSFLNISHSDFVYIDPPYMPETKKSFVKYVVGGFNAEDHESLFEKIKNLDKSISFIMSNSKVEYVLQSFSEYNIEDVVARRAINSKNPGDSTIEVLICNYS